MKANNNKPVHERQTHIQTPPVQHHTQQPQARPPQSTSSAPAASTPIPHHLSKETQGSPTTVNNGTNTLWDKIKNAVSSVASMGITLFPIIFFVFLFIIALYFVLQKRCKNNYESGTNSSFIRGGC